MSVSLSKPIHQMGLQMSQIGFVESRPSYLCRVTFLAVGEFFLCQADEGIQNTPEVKLILSHTLNMHTEILSAKVSVFLKLGLGMLQSNHYL